MIIGHRECSQSIDESIKMHRKGARRAALIDSTPKKLTSLIPLASKRVLAVASVFVLCMIPPIADLAVAEIQGDRSCLSQCHGQLDHEVKLNGEAAQYVDIAKLRSSAHQDLACVDCHQDITKVPHAEDIQPVRCVNCHYKGNPRQAPSGEYQDYVESVHAQMETNGRKKPSCVSCHGVHDILSPEDEQSKVHKLHVPETCRQCHQGIYEEFVLSIHGKALLWDSILDSPSCVDCHGVHRIIAHDDPESRVHPTHVSQTCAECHAAVEIVEQYGISAERVTTYQESFHGLANKYGVRAVANCASCHGVHNILASADPASSIHPDNLHDTCGQGNCHPQAIEAFSLGPIHLGVVESRYDVARWIEVVYVALIVVVVGGMILHNILDYVSLHRRNHNENH